MQKENLINTFNHKLLKLWKKKKKNRVGNMYYVLSTIWEFDENIFYMYYVLCVNMP